MNLRNSAPMLFIAIIGVLFFGVFLFFILTPEPVVTVRPPVTLELTSVVTGKPEAVLVIDLQISTTAVTNVHGCFSTEMSLPMLTETYQMYDNALPISPVEGLTCYNAQNIRADLAADMALPFLSRADVADGMDRVVVVYDDGRGFVWNQPKNINE